MNSNKYNKLFGKIRKNIIIIDLYYIIIKNNNNI